jgi:hypothetical protein
VEAALHQKWMELMGKNTIKHLSFFWSDIKTCTEPIESERFTKVCLNGLHQPLSRRKTGTCSVFHVRTVHVPLRVLSQVSQIFFLEASWQKKMVSGDQPAG